MEESTKALVREFNLTNPIAEIQNNHTVNWNIISDNVNIPFSHMIVRRLWAHYRKTHIDSELCKKYSKIVSDLPALDPAELKWYHDNNFDTIFDNFLKCDVNEAPIYLVFCLETGDEILIRRVMSADEDAYFQIINCEYSKFANTVPRNQLGPIRVQRELSGEMVCVFVSK
jgi:hypothetical protein